MMKQRVGVIGGGQLAWMMGPAAQKLGIDLAIQTPHPSDPATAIAQHTVLGAIDDATATAQLAQYADVITFENEFIDRAALTDLANQGVRFAPSLTALAPLLDKWHQRSYLQKLGLPTPHFTALDDHPSSETLSQFGFPVVLKARRLGYDGYGTFIAQDLTALEAALALQNQALKAKQLDPADHWLLEEFVPFDRELAVMVARSAQGEIVTYPVVETQQQQQVCRRVIVTADLDPAITQQVQPIAAALLTQLEYVGVMGIEFFLTAAGNVLVNETAPRTHNSGHYSLDACATSQFEQQLRAVCGLPLGSPELTCPGAVMVNLLGFEAAENDYAAQRQQLAALPQAHVYWYGKNVARPGRKLGHVTVRLDAHQGRSAALQVAEQVEAIWYPQ